MTDCDVCQDLTGDQARYLETIVTTKDAAAELYGLLKYLHHLAGQALHGEALDQAQSQVTELTDQVAPVLDALSLQVEHLGFDEIDSLCEPNEALQHLRAVVACYERMGRLHHFISGRFADWQVRRAEAEQLPRDQQHDFLYAVTPPSPDVADAERRERAAIWTRAKARTHRAQESDES